MFFFYTTFLTFAQSDSLSNKRSVISLDKVKTIYRGIANPISIAVSGCKSYEVSGLGLEEVSKGKYTLIPGQGNETKIIVSITNFDDSISVEEHVFKIGNIPNVSAKINNQNCYNCIVELSAEEIKNSIISIGINDFKFDLDFDGEFYQVKEFDIVLKRNKIKVTGNKFSKEAIAVINKLKVGSIFYIENIKYPNPYNICRGVVYPIKVMIKE